MHMLYHLSLAVGILLLVISLIFLRTTLAFLKNSERATAVVTKLETIEDSEGTTYKPVFTFRTAAGAEYLCRPNFSSSPASWAVGEETVIVYNPQDPTDAKLLTYFGTFSWTIILMAVAMPFIVIGAGYQVAQQFLK